MSWFFSILILSLALYRLITYYNKVKNYYKVAATIVGNDVKTVEDTLMGNQYYYAAIVEFTDKDGNVKQLISAEENPGRPLYNQGAKLTVLVHPADSNRFLMYDFVDGYFIPLIWIVIGISIALIPIIFSETFK
jgi:hypothetical protein